MGTFITFPELLIWLPFLAGIAVFFSGSEKNARILSFSASLLVLAVSVISLFYSDNKYYNFNYVNYYWLKYIGNSFYVGLDGAGRVLTLLTAISFPIILLSSFRHSYKNPSVFYGLLLLAQCGMMGVFCSLDVLLFYFFWELALIPVYFLSSIWGGSRRIQVTFKFFIYTFLGSLLMLAGILYVYQHTPGRMFDDGTYSAHSFAIKSFYASSLNAFQQGWLFCLFFIAFAIKMPIFPFHTWQPDTYDQAPAPVTMVLSGLMVKMGLLGVIRWLIPLFPLALPVFGKAVMVLSIIGIVYASCIALMQDSLRKMAAYSSIAHIGLMCAALFTHSELGIQGVMIQMFSHGINIIGLWIVIDMLEQKTGCKNISELSGVAGKAPALTIFLLIIVFANIALPLTNAFAGEMMMFGGLFQYNKWFAALAALSIILAAIYMLNMVRKVFLGESNAVVEVVSDISWNQKLLFGLITAIIFVTGVYPQILVDISKEAVGVLMGNNI